MQAGQVSDDGHAVSVRVSVAAGVLGQPQHLETAQLLQVLQLRQTRDLIASQIELAELLTRRDVLQRRDLISTENTQLLHSHHESYYDYCQRYPNKPQCENLNIRNLHQYTDLWTKSTYCEKTHRDGNTVIDAMALNE